MSRILIIGMPVSESCAFARTARDGRWEPIFLDSPPRRLFSPESAPAAVIVDACANFLGGLEACRAAKEMGRGRLPVLFLSPDAEADKLLAGYGAGADECLAHPWDPRVLLAYTAALVRFFGNTGTGLRPLRAGVLTLDSGKRTVDVDGKPVRLTAGETAILEVLIRRRGFPITRSDLFEMVRGTASDAGPHSIDTHVCNLRKKLGRTGKLIRSVYRIGYMLEG